MTVERTTRGIAVTSAVVEIHVECQRGLGSGRTDRRRTRCYAHRRWDTLWSAGTVHRRNSRQEWRNMMPDPETIDGVRRARQEWERRELTAFLARQPESQAEYRTRSGLPLKRVYTPEDVVDTAFDRIGFPGRY